MKSILMVAMLLLSLSFSITADDDQRSETIIYNGQPAEAFDLSWDKQGTLYRTIQVPGTCYNQVPYEDEECGNRTYYRNECRTIRGYNDCDTFYDNICRNVTRTRRECSRGPSRLSCHTTPVRRVCRDRPTRRVCRTNARGQQVCNNVGGGQTCTNHGGDRRCTTFPGEQTCKNVPYTDRECDRVARQQCSWVPSREQCEDVPYQQYECWPVTRYRSVPYDCMVDEQEPYQGIVAKYRAQVEVNFIGNSKEEISLVFTIGDDGKIIPTLKDEVRDIVIVKKNQQTAEPNDGVTEIKASFTIQIIDKRILEAPFKEEIDAKLKRKAQVLEVRTTKLFELEGLKADIILKKKSSKKPLIEQSINLATGPFVTKVDEGNNSFITFKLNGLMKKKIRRRTYNLFVRVKKNINANQVLNTVKPTLKVEKSFNKIKTVK